MRPTSASVVLPVAAAPPEVLHSRVEHQVVGLRGEQFTVKHSCSPASSSIDPERTEEITSVPPDVKMMSSAFPPTILATFSLASVIMALALAPTTQIIYTPVRKKQHSETNLETTCFSLTTFIKCLLVEASLTCDVTAARVPPGVLERLRNHPDHLWFQRSRGVVVHVDPVFEHPFNWTFTELDSERMSETASYLSRFISE